MRRLILLGAATALLIAACSDGAAAPSTSSTSTSLIVTTTSTTPPTTSFVPPQSTADDITVWAPEIVVDLVETAADRFQIDSGVGVEVVAMETETVLEQLLADPSAGPSVFVGPHTWLTTLATAGIAEPISSRSEVVAGAVAAVELRQAVLAAPLGLDAVVQFRDTTQLAIAPNSAESLAAGCPDGEDTVPCLLLPVDSVEGHYPFIVAAGGYVFGPDPFEGWARDDVGVDTDAAVAGMLLLETIVDGGGILGDGSSGVAARFADGDAPLLWGGMSTLADLEASGVRFVTETLPPIADEPAIPAVSVTAAWVNAFAPEKDAASSFVAGYLSDPEIADEIAIRLGLAPVNIGFDGDAARAVFVDAARVGHPVPTIFQTEFAWDQLAGAFAQIRSGSDVAGTLMDVADEIRDAPEPEPPATEDESDG